MLVKCKHYSITYPTGMQNVGDIFDVTKLQADFYFKMGWIEILPDELQPGVKRGKKKKETSCAIDLSKSLNVDRHLEHNFSQKK